MGAGNLWFRVFSRGEKLLAAHFRMEVDSAGCLLFSAIEKEHSSALSALFQLAATLEDGISDVGAVIQSVEQTALIPELFTRYR